jgi:hypothetical protein
VDGLAAPATTVSIASLCIGFAELLSSETLVIVEAMGTDDRFGVPDAMGTDEGFGVAVSMGTGIANAKGIGCKTILGFATTMAMDWSDWALGEAGLLQHPEQPRLPVPPQPPVTAALRLIPLSFPIPCCSWRRPIVPCW